MNLSPRWVAVLDAAGIDSTHWYLKIDRMLLDKEPTPEVK
jgi:hypothetical protein